MKRANDPAPFHRLPMQRSAHRRDGSTIPTVTQDAADPWSTPGFGRAQAPFWSVMTRVMAAARGAAHEGAVHELEALDLGREDLLQAALDAELERHDRARAGPAGPVEVHHH